MMKRKNKINRMKNLILALLVFSSTSLWATNPGFLGRHLVIGYAPIVSHPMMTFDIVFNKPEITHRFKLGGVVSSNTLLCLDYGYKNSFNFCDLLQAKFGDNTPLRFLDGSYQEHKFSFGVKSFKGGHLAPTGKYFSAMLNLDFCSYDYQRTSNGVKDASATNSLITHSISLGYGQNFRMGKIGLFDYGVEVSLPITYLGQFVTNGSNSNNGSTNTFTDIFFINNVRYEFLRMKFGFEFPLF
jgi:hypothetical protein